MEVDATDITNVEGIEKIPPGTGRASVLPSRV